MAASAAYCLVSAHDSARRIIMAYSTEQLAPETASTRPAAPQKRTIHGRAIHPGSKTSAARRRRSEAESAEKVPHPAEDAAKHIAEDDDDEPGAKAGAGHGSGGGRAADYAWTHDVSDYLDKYHGSATATSRAPLLMMRAMRSYAEHDGVRSLADAWGDVVELLDSGAPAPLELFDECIAIVMHHLDLHTFPLFLKSDSFTGYTHVAHFAATNAAVDHTDFDFIGRLGQGGYGSVFAGRKKNTGKLYALKCMDKRLIKVRRATKLVVTERHVLAAVESPFITGLKYAFHNRSECVLAMDMLAGGDLEYYLIRKGRFAEELMKFYMAECLLGLKYLHDRGIMHRDIKPSNILLGTDGHVRLSDLGLAVFVGNRSAELDDDGMELASGAPPTPTPRKYIRGKAGTPGFWAPEMLYRDADGRAGKYDHRADMWSFGCLMYALLAGRGPFTVVGGDTDDDNDATLHATPRFPPDIFSSAAKNIIKSLLARNPAERLGCGPRGWLEVMEHPFFHGIEWTATAEKRVTPPWKPPYDAVIPDTSPTKKDAAREIKLRAVALTPQDHAHYCDIPFASLNSVREEIVENLTLQTATAAGVSFSGFTSSDWDTFRRGGKVIADSKMPAPAEATASSTATSTAGHGAAKRAKQCSMM